MNLRRVLLCGCVWLGCADLAVGQFQRSLVQPRRGRLSGTTAVVPLAVSCLDYGIPAATERDLIARVTPGRAFLVREAPAGEQRIDINQAMQSGWVVLRGSGQGQRLLAEVRVPGWDAIEFLPGAQALPPRAEPAEVPPAVLELLEDLAGVEQRIEALPDGPRGLLERLLTNVRQEHVWGLYSNSRQALDPGLSILPQTLRRIEAMREDPTLLARMEWLLRQRLDPAGSKALNVFLAGTDQRPGMDFLGDCVVLRCLKESEGARPLVEVCTAGGTQRVALSHDGLRRLGPMLESASPGRVILTTELLETAGKGGLATALDRALASTGHAVGWRVADDGLLLEDFAPGPAVRRRFAVVAPETPAEAMRIFGRGASANFAFKALIDEGRVERVRTTADLRRLAAGGADAARLVLVCRQRFGRIPLADGAQLAWDDLPAGVAEVIACDALDLREKLPVEPAGRATFGYDGLAAAVRVALEAAETGDGLTRADLASALVAGYQAHWKRQAVPVPPVVRFTRTSPDTAYAAGGAGTVLKILSRRR